MNANNMYKLLLIFLISCNKIPMMKVNIDNKVCHFEEFKLEFMKNDTIENILQNQKIASLCYYKQKELLKNTINCYEKVIQELQK